jgi:hypothetical protein
MLFGLCIWNQAFFRSLFSRAAGSLKTDVALAAEGICFQRFHSLGG